MWHLSEINVCCLLSLFSFSSSFILQALSDAGQGSWSLKATGQTLPGPPAAVTDLALVGRNVNKISHSNSDVLSTCGSFV